MLYRPGHDPTRVYFGTDTHAGVLLVGVALGVATAGSPRFGRAARAALVPIGLVAAGALAVAFTSLTIDTAWLYEGGYIGIGLAVVGVLLAAQAGRGPLRAILESRGLVALGLVSYGVYVWHWPFYVWLTPTSTGLTGTALFLARSTATLAVAIPSYYLVEMPIRRGRLPRFGVRNPAFAPAVLVTAVAGLLLVPATIAPAVVSVPAAVGVSASTRAVTLRYAAAPRCDAPVQDPPLLGTPARPFRVQLVGNSFAGEINLCLGTFLRARGARLDPVLQIGDTICNLATAIRRPLHSRDRPTVAVLFEYPVPNPQAPTCSNSKPYPTEVRDTVRVWVNAGVHVLLVADVPPAGSSMASFDGTGTVYRQVARMHPKSVTVVDPGVFLRDGSGRYQWRMPCVAHEQGCNSSGTVGVRWPGDQGLHFCSDPDFAKHVVCPTTFAAGERRVTATVATAILALNAASR